MKTFEAKGILKEYIGHKGDKWEVSMTDEDIKEFKNIIDLLEQGEKYKKMWEELKVVLKRIIEIGFDKHYHLSNILIKIESLNKKYFLKENIMDTKKTISYKKILEEIINENGMVFVNDNGCYRPLSVYIRNLEQRYFPKELKDEKTTKL